MIAAVPLSGRIFFVNQNWHGTLIRHMLLLVTACLVIGLITGYYGWSLAAGLGLYLAWTLKQLLRLHRVAAPAQTR